MTERLKIYISGPISNGGRATSAERMENVKVAIRLMVELMRLDYAVLCPQLTEFVDLLSDVKLPHSLWIENDLPWVRSSDAVYRLAGESTGSDMEVAEAQRVGVTVVHSIEELERFRITREEQSRLELSVENPEGLAWK